MATAFILSSRTVPNGVLTSRHSRWSSGFPPWQRKLLGMQRSLLLPRGFWSQLGKLAVSRLLPAALLKGAPLAACLSGLPAMNRAGYLHHFHTTKLYEFISNSLPSNKPKSVKFCLLYSSNRCLLTCRMFMHKGTEEIRVRIWSFLLRLVSKRHNSARTPSLEIFKARLDTFLCNLL